MPCAAASAEQRDALWAAVADAGTDALDVPRRIVWDSTRKQREYLNVRDDADHDAIYYAHRVPLSGPRRCTL